MRNRSQLGLGIILILLGAWFIAQRQYPALNDLVQVYLHGSLRIVAAGGLILLIGLILGAPGMAVAAAIVAGIGAILYYQETVRDFTSWSYMWALIPGFAGIGEILAGVLSSNNSRARSGLNAVGVSAILFIIFAAFFNKLSILGPYGPAVLLILLGAWLFGRGLWRKS